ncbi:cyclopentanone-monooxygenase-like protein [Colletotrichum incanum]|nr:cyclopentanone-monooxygenase-like protein [Colletotrichum incanum]
MWVQGSRLNYATTGSIDHLDNSRLNGKGQHIGTPDTTMDCEVLVVGGGSGGCCALHHLRKQGFSRTLWRPDLQWRACGIGTDVLDISKDVNYNTVVVGTDYDTKTVSCLVRTDTGRSITLRFLILAAGSSIKRYEHQCPGKESLRGTMEITKQPCVELTVCRSLKAIYRQSFKAARESVPKSLSDYNPKLTAETTAEERDVWWEELWQQGGFNFQGELLDMTFRLRHNVKVVDVKKTRILKWTTRDIMTDDGREREHDIIVLATGYDSMTGALTGIGWKEGVWTHLGPMTRGCPNMFMLYGPQAPTALTNGPPFIEQEVEVTADFLTKLRKERVRSIEPRQSAKDHWKTIAMAAHEATLFRKCDSS